MLVRENYFCPQIGKDCIREKCLAFSNHRQLSEREIENMNAGDIPVLGSAKRVDYCHHYRKELIPIFRTVNK